MVVAFLVYLWSRCLYKEREYYINHYLTEESSPQKDKEFKNFSLDFPVMFV